MLALIRLAPVSPPYRRLAALLLAIPPAIFLFLGATHTKLSTRSGLTLVHPSWHTATYRDTRDSSHDSELKTHTIISGTPHVDMTFIDSSTELQLGIVSRIYVVSLPRRTDRRHRMHQLGHTLGLNWTYVDAVDIDNPAIAAILRQVRVLRNNVVSFSALSSTISNIASNTSGNTAMSKFDWPTEIDVLTSSDDPLALAGSDIWTHSSTHSSFDPSLVGETLDKFSLDLHLKNFIYRPPRPLVNLACTSGNALLPPRMIRAIATSNDEGPVLVLEDDIDMERDIQERLTTVWDALPADWDIVYLGHCWSNERIYPALRRGTASALHPSSAPKCTHAYVLSRRGARRILLHLRHPPFAYSRAIDQALAWLVHSGRLSAFSIVPPVIVQRKDVSSDVVSGRGSDWREVLANGVLESMEMPNGTGY